MKLFDATDTIDNINSILSQDTGTTSLVMTSNAIRCSSSGGSRSIENTARTSRSQRLTTAQKSIAQSRLDLLIKYMDAFSGSGYGDVLTSKRTFLDMYNSGNLYPNLYKKLGTITFGTIEKWLKTYLEAQRDWMSLIPGYNYNLSPVLPLTADEQTVFLKYLLAPSKLKIAKAIYWTKKQLQANGLLSPSCEKTFYRFADKWKQQHQDIWIFMREGEKARKDQLEPYIVRNAKLLKVGQCLVSDGKTTTFDVINPFTGKPQKVTIIAHIDWRSKYVCGYEIMLTENTAVIAASLRRAILALGRVPEFVLTDNGRAFKAKFFTNIDLNDTEFDGLFGKLGIKHVLSRAYNARSKVIERVWSEFVQGGEKLLPAYTGTSPVDKPGYMMRNEKFHAILHQANVRQTLHRDVAALTMDEACDFFAAWLNYYHSQPCPHEPDKTIQQVWESGISNPPLILESELDELMLMHDARQYTIRRNGISAFNADYYNDNLYGRQGEKVTIRYSMFDLSNIKIYDTKGRFIADCKRVEMTHPLAVHLGTEKDINHLKGGLVQQKLLKKKTERETKQLMRQHELNSGLMTGTYAARQLVVSEVLEDSECPAPAGRIEESRTPVTSIKNPYTDID